MNSCSQWFVWWHRGGASRRRDVCRVAAVAACLALSACANKGATSLDEQANQPASERAGVGANSDEPRCGNGVIDEDEECDGEDVDGVTCVNLGFESGQLTCDPMICTFETAGCVRAPVAPMGGAGG